MGRGGDERERGRDRERERQKEGGGKQTYRQIIEKDEIVCL